MPSTRGLRLALLPALAVGAASCGPEDERERAASGAASVETAEEAGLIGTWQLDAETREWLPRACVRLGFPDPATATFDVEQAGDEVVVRLNTPHRTAWRVRSRARGIEGQQVVPTTETGRFCGRETPVWLRLRETSPGVLTGVWKTPECDVCPDRPFGATRVPSLTGPGPAQ